MKTRISEDKLRGLPRQIIVSSSPRRQLWLANVDSWQGHIQWRSTAPWVPPSFQCSLEHLSSDVEYITHCDLMSLAQHFEYVYDVLRTSWACLSSYEESESLEDVSEPGTKMLPFSKNCPRRCCLRSSRRRRLTAFNRSVIREVVASRPPLNPSKQALYTTGLGASRFLRRYEKIVVWKYALYL